MVVYWGACLSSILFTWVATHITHRRCKNDFLYWFLITFFSAFPLIFISAIRYNVGADYTAYYKYYIEITEGGGRGRFESLYYLLNKVVAFLGGSAPWLFGLAAVLFLLPVYRTILRDSPYPCLSVFLLVGTTLFFYFLNGTRQMIGTAFLFLSIPFLEKNKFVPFTILILIASGFHTMCLVFLAVYFLICLRFTPKILVGITAVIFLSDELLSRIAAEIIGRMSYYSDYLETSFNEKGRGYIVLCIDIVLVVFSTIYYQKGNDKFRVYYNLQVLALWASALTGKIVLVERFRLSFSMASIILLPMTIKGIKDKKTRRIIAIIVFAMYFLYATYTVGVQNSNLVLPYQTIFNTEVGV